VILEPRDHDVVWLDGEFIPWSKATMHVSDHHYGFGVFEGVRAYQTGEGAHVFRLRDHTARLLRSARILNIELPERYDCKLLDEVQVELLRRNRLGNAYLRPFVFYGGVQGLSPRARSAEVHVAVMAVGWGESDAEAAKRSLTLRTASFTRHHPNSLLSKAKANGNYMNGILAVREAIAAGADDALLLDQGGYATETSGANLFIVRGTSLQTPSLESALDGITRDTVIELASAHGLRIQERRMTRDELYGADEAFLTGTATEIAAISEIDGRRIGTAPRGPVTEKLQAMFASLVRGRSDRHREWLTSV
jgi:branched-chain amino acid aminotransferase